MRAAYLGNFGPSHSTENHVALSLEAIGVEVLRVQEGIHCDDVVKAVRNFGPDFFLHTQTYGLAVTSGTIEARRRMTEQLKALPTKTVYFHLDRWWGLSREDQLLNPDTREPWAEYDFVFTADGGHDEQWSSIGTNHYWLPPAVYHGEAFDGQLRPSYRCDVGFVGSWRSYGHPEWEPQRMAMLDTLRKKYGRRFKCFPTTHAIRGAELNNLYASIKVVVGDSCLAGSPPMYWSDRIPETIGRGGFLVHPMVEGLGWFHSALQVWELGNYDSMLELIDANLANPEYREKNRIANCIETRERNTYKNRMQSLLEIVCPTP